MVDFEWDPAKAEANLAKHGVDFEVARNVFQDPAAIIEPDNSDPEEERWRAIGLAGGEVFVVFTERNDDVTRIISARKANKREEGAYFGQTAP